MTPDFKLQTVLIVLGKMPHLVIQVFNALPWKPAPGSDPGRWHCFNSLIQGAEKRDAKILKGLGPSYIHPLPFLFMLFPYGEILAPHRPTKNQPPTACPTENLGGDCSACYLSE